MTIEEALNELIISEAFKEASKKDGKLRTYLVRIRNNELKAGAAVELLTQFGYEVIIKGPRKIVTKKKE